jgi:hypothetical protein
VAIEMTTGVDVVHDEAFKTGKTQWFGDVLSVQLESGRRQVFVAGTLIGSFGQRERGIRNALLLGLSEDKNLERGMVCKALGVSREMLRQLREVAERDGVEGALARGPKGRKPKVTEALRRRVEKSFAKGMTVDQAHEGVRHLIGRTSVVEIRKGWAGRVGRPEPARSQRVVPSEPPGTSSAGEEERASANEGDAPQLLPGTVAALLGGASLVSLGAEQAEAKSDETARPGATEEGDGTVTTPCSLLHDPAPEEFEPAEIAAAPVRSAPYVQHLGTWLMLAMVASLGLHHHVEALCKKRKLGPAKARAARIALDAVICALCIYQKCVEGVRRLQTPSASVLLGAKRCPSASWVRTVLGGLAHTLGGALLHLWMAREYVERSRDADSAPIVFYVDNHLRTYTGKRKLLKGWKMQDKRARPGTMDYYVHDEDGRPLLRVDTMANSPLTDWLSPLAKILRDMVGPGPRILIGFDRGGAFPEQMARLRDDHVDFLTYERAPYRRFSASAFTESFEAHGETIGVCDTRTNLGKGRGRVRRIALRMSDGKQINLLAVGDVTAESGYAIARGRWNQENGMKHGIERWGANQLDGRQFDDVDPEKVIPNPGRRRLDRAMRLATIREGRARTKLARLRRDDPARKRWSLELKEARAQQERLLAQRPHLPTHAPLEDTDLAGKLVRHRGEYKMLIDTARIACANAESELAALLGPQLRRPAEAKKVLANLLVAPGSVTVGNNTIAVRLKPAGSRSELDALGTLLGKCNAMNLTLPADSRRRPLRFSLQLS